MMRAKMTETKGMKRSEGRSYLSTICAWRSAPTMSEYVLQRQGQKNHRERNVSAQKRFAFYIGSNRQRSAKAPSPIGGRIRD